MNDAPTMHLLRTKARPHHGYIDRNRVSRWTVCGEFKYADQLTGRRNHPRLCENCARVPLGADDA